METDYKVKRIRHSQYEGYYEIQFKGKRIEAGGPFATRVTALKHMQALINANNETARIRHQAKVKFFFDNAGFSYDPKIETEQQGHQRCAMELAKAEEYARQQELIFEWQGNDTCIACDCGDSKCKCCKGKRHESFTCLLWDAESKNVLASLGSICEPTSEYRRVIEAELALEAMPTA